MRLLTVPQFARRVSRSVDEVLALIQTREVKALRPEPEGGYRVLESEVDRLLQEKTGRIRPRLSKLGEVSRSVPLENHLSTVTQLETARTEVGRQERVNLNLQSELFTYRQLLESEQQALFEARATVISHQEEIKALKQQLQALRSAPWWKRLFGVK